MKNKNLALNISRKVKLDQTGREGEIENRLELIKDLQQT